MAMIPLDRIDLSLLAELQRGGRLTNAELAERVHLSPSACLRRVQRLERDGVISGYRAEVDAEGLPDENTVSKAAVYLNRKLPRTRTITQGLVRDAEGRVMLCQLSYKKFWDLPGGVVDPYESPAHALVREIAEELGATATITGLRVVSWLPPWRGWDDAMLYLFDVELDRPAGEFALQRKEIAGIHFVGLDELDDHVAAYTAKVIRRAVTAIENGESGVYLENGDEPGWA